MNSAEKLHTTNFSLEVGRLVVGTIERELRAYLHQNDFQDYKLERDMGLFHGYLHVSVTDKPERVLQFMKLVKTWIELNGGDT